MFTVPLRPSACTAPSPVWACRSASRGIRTSMWRFLELWPQEKPQWPETRAVSSTLSPSWRESTRRSLPSSYPWYWTRNSTCLPSPGLTRTLPSLVSTCTLARPVTTNDFTTSSAWTAGTKVAAAARTAHATAIRATAVRQGSGFICRPSVDGVLKKDTKAGVILFPTLRLSPGSPSGGLWRPVSCAQRRACDARLPATFPRARY